MPRVSKTRELSSQKKSLFLDDLYSAITSLKDKNEVRVFFEDLLTKEEKLMLAKRFQIAMMHRLIYLWEEISKRVKVTNTTVAKIQQRFSYDRGGLKKVADRIIALKEKKFKKITQGRKKEFLGPAVFKAGLGILIQEKKKSKKQKSITS